MDFIVRFTTEDSQGIFKNGFAWNPRREKVGLSGLDFVRVEMANPAIDMTEVIGETYPDEWGDGFLFVDEGTAREISGKNGFFENTNRETVEVPKGFLNDFYRKEVKKCGHEYRIHIHLNQDTLLSCWRVGGFQKRWGFKTH